MKGLFKRKTGSFSANMTSGDVALDNKSPVAIRKTRPLTLEVPSIAQSESSPDLYGATVRRSNAGSSKSNPPSPVRTPPSMRKFRKTASLEHSLHVTRFTSFSSAPKGQIKQLDTIPDHCDSMASLSTADDELYGSSCSLQSFNDEEEGEQSPLSVSMTSLNFVSFKEEDERAPRVTGDEDSDEMDHDSRERADQKAGGGKKKKGIFNIFHKRRVSEDHGKKDQEVANISRRSNRSQSLTPENNREVMEKIKELQLTVRGKEEELRMLNASIDQANMTWEEKYKALQKDVESERRKNEKLMHYVQETLPAPSKSSKRIAVPKNLSSGDVRVTSPNREGAKVSQASNSSTPPTKREGLREFRQKKIVAKTYEKNPETRRKLLNAISASKCLQQLSLDLRTKIVDVMKVKKIARGERLMQGGTLGQAFYVMAEGSCRLYKTGEELTPDISNMTAGEAVRPWTVFGEVDVFYHTRRVFNCRSVQPGVVWYITRDEFRSVAVQQDIGRRKKDVIYFLRCLKLNVDVAALKRAVHQCKVEHFSSGDYIIRQDDVINHIYVIKEGEVAVTKHLDGTESVEKVLKSGHVLGQKSSGRHYANSYVASGDDIVQCILLPSDEIGHDLLRGGSTSERVTEDNVIKNIRIRDTISTDGAAGSSGSSGYGSANSFPTEKRKPLRTDYGEKHEQQYKSISASLKGKVRSSFNYISTIGTGAFGSVDLVSTKTGDYNVFAIKRLSKEEITAAELQDQVQSERFLQMKSSQQCPFIVSLYSTFDDQKFAYLVMEYCGGGELFTLMKGMKKLDDSFARFYTACVIEGLTFLHSRNVVYRDLKPENVVIDRSGYCKLTDFGFAKKLTGRSSLRTYTFCGTPEYMAPETILYKAQTLSVDLWALGIFIFEILTGKAPFRNRNRKDLSDLILAGVESHLEDARALNKIGEEAGSLIGQLCQIRPEERLGAGRDAIKDVTSHNWFDGFDWTALRLRTLTPPWKPNLKTVHDTHYFDNDATKESGKEFDNF